MTHKSYYEAAAAEVAAGRLDNALWIKVNAEMPDADNSVRQAKYIALRAQELATANAGTMLRKWTSVFHGRRWYWWLGLLVAIYLLMGLVALPFVR